MGTEIFFGKSEIRLDTPVNKRPDGQITARRREQNPLVSRTRCSALRAAPQSRDLYCHLLSCEVDPGSAAHRCALRCIRGTTGADNGGRSSPFASNGIAPSWLQRGCNRWQLECSGTEIARSILRGMIRILLEFAGDQMVQR